VIDVGGTNVKVLGPGGKEIAKIPSGPTMTAAKMVKEVRSLVDLKRYSRVSIGYPGPVMFGRAVRDPHNLAPGWVGFDFEKAFRRPVKIINDAALQALGSYEGGRMLFLGLGTGLGSALIVEGVVGPMELAHLPYRNGRTYESYVGNPGLKRLGKRKWKHHVLRIVSQLKAALQTEYVVLGGGNVRLLKKLPKDVHRGQNCRAYEGGCRLWEDPRRIAERAFTLGVTKRPLEVA
jgi:polyphosphate glucokinase